MHEYRTFSGSSHDQSQEPMFFGYNVTVARYDKQRYPIFEKLTEKQLSFFWRPEEVDLSKDSKDWQKLPDHEQRIFIRNLQYQILLDSVQGRSPNVAFLPLCSLPELETWFETWGFYETIHSRSYTHILRNLFTDPSPVFDEIVTIPEICERAVSVTAAYDTLVESPSKEALYAALMAANILEGIRFYVSFACSFSFAERELMEGNAKIIKLIARDEALHLSGTQHMINLLIKDDPDFKAVADENVGLVDYMFKQAVDQEKAWANYLFSEGSMIGLNAAILHSYIEHICDVRRAALGLGPMFGAKPTPLPWMSTWLTSDNVQVAPQETEISSYLVGQIDKTVGDDDLTGFEL